MTVADDAHLAIERGRQIEEGTRLQAGEAVPIQGLAAHFEAHLDGQALQLGRAEGFIGGRDVHVGQFQMLLVGLAIGEGASLQAGQQPLTRRALWRGQQHIATGKGGELRHGQAHRPPVQGERQRQGQPLLLRAWWQSGQQ
ncbi:hypothetical protein D3C80_1517970 [compost metagenome]